jgi:hypothetical protein
LVIAALALAATLAGTAIAAGPEATTSALSKKKVKKIARKQINKLAPGLSVASADTANSADTADSANTADSAKTADSANTANRASNAGALQGASLASIAAGNDAFISDCNPNTAAYVQCGNVQLTLAREAKVLVIYGWRWSDNNADGIGLGRCRTTRNGADTSGDISMGESLNWQVLPAPDPPVHSHTGGDFDYAAPPVVDVQGPLQPGTYSFGLRCNDVFGADAIGPDIRYTGIRIAAVVMGTG